MSLGHLNHVSANVARILREEREKRGLSMTVLAARAGLSRAMISFVEREVRNPSLETMLRIAYVLEIDLGKIITKANRQAAKK